jgi:exopolysaccharide biosynthesis polyprenyl glycosylphosphotransferase
MRELYRLNASLGRASHDAALPVVDESAFKFALVLERRRCERTGLPFALMLVETAQIKNALSVAALEEVASAVSFAMRETDVTGWYENGSTIGVILTTLNGSDLATLESVVIPRVKTTLGSLLDSIRIESIQITLRMFPEDTNNVTPDRGSNETSDRGVPKGDSKINYALKRLLDAAGSLCLLILLLPLFVIIAAAIKLTSEGPVFFRQKRIGQFGEHFTFLKFRSMYVNNDPAIHKEYIRNLIGKKVNDTTFKIKNDPRVTPIGRFIRKTSLDELPQFINVLKGEMSLVGPRPPIPYEFESYALWHRRRLEAKPGITGEWQVHGRSRTTFDDMVRMDLRYIRNQSVWLDLKLLLKTPFAVVSGDGAY